MKKWLFIAVFVCLLVGCKKEIDVFSVIDDAEFKTYCVQFDTNQDGKLSFEECSLVTKIDICGTWDSVGQITSLKGIEFFPNLKVLKCNHNKLCSLDISHNLHLDTVYCFHNQFLVCDGYLNNGFGFNPQK